MKTHNHSTVLHRKLCVYFNTKKTRFIMQTVSVHDKHSKRLEINDDLLRNDSAIDIAGSSERSL